MKNYWLILEIPESSTVEEIKKAFRKLALVYHPDVASTGDTKRFIEIKEAYDYLIKNQSRPEPTVRYGYTSPEDFWSASRTRTTRRQSSSMDMSEEEVRKEEEVKKASEAAMRAAMDALNRMAAQAQMNWNGFKVEMDAHQNRPKFRMVHRDGTIDEFWL